MGLSKGVSDDTLVSPTSATVMEAPMAPVVATYESSSSTKGMEEPGAISLPALAQDSADLGKATITRDAELERMAKLRELAEVADKHLVEIKTPEGLAIRPMRVGLEQVQTIENAKSRRQRQSRVVVCTIC